MSATQGTSGFGTSLHVSDGGTKASHVSGSGDARITWTARQAGTAGNSITVAISTAGGATPVVSVAGSAISVSCDASTTALEIVSAIRAKYEANALVTVAATPGDGSGNVVTFSAANLSGGVADAYTELAEVKSITGPNISLETIDATHHQSPSGHREMLPSFKSAGEVSFDINFLPGVGTHQTLFDLWSNRTLRKYKIIFPDTSNTDWIFEAYVSNLSISAPIDDVLGASVTLMLSGAINFNP